MGATLNKIYRWFWTLEAEPEPWDIDTLEVSPNPDYNPRRSSLLGAQRKPGGGSPYRKFLYPPF